MQDKKKKPGKEDVQNKKTLDFGDEEFSKALVAGRGKNGTSLKEDEKVLPRCVTDRTYLEIKSQSDMSSQQNNNSQTSECLSPLIL